MNEMYEAYWKLTKKPFGLRPVTDQIFRSRTQQAALLRLRYCIENEAGMALLLGISGSGKSATIRSLMQSSDQLRPFVHVLFPTLKADEILRLVAEEIMSGLAGSGSSGTAEQTLQRIRRKVSLSSSAGQHTVICFDDAHQLNDDVLTSAVLPLLNISDLTDCRLTVVLSGQPVLAARIRRHHQLSERTAVIASIEGLTLEEVSSYVGDCMRSAGAAAEIFNPSAIQRLLDVTGGNPRRINRLCDMALLVGCAENLTQISSEEIDAVSQELLLSAA
ncbi:MAG: AAA family ATPase [Planctomyces sp.]|nr:AAA family ATPase [Planctomyces sp.]